MSDELNPQPLDNFLPILAKEDSVRRFLAAEHGDRAAILLELMESPHELPDEFNFLTDALIEFIHDNSEEIDSFEFECLSSYSETSTVSIHRFSGIFWVGNLEFGDICTSLPKRTQSKPRRSFNNSVTSAMSTISNQCKAGVAQAAGVLLRRPESLFSPGDRLSR